jgi:putative methyltransferase (TIGR04325 family)
MVLETYSSLDPQLISNRENLPIFQERIKIFQELVGKSVSSIGAKLEYRILDIGGGNGYFAKFLRLAFPKHYFNYTVLESPAIANLYRKKFLGSKIEFVDDFSDISEIDIVFISCFLQYVENAESFLHKSTLLTNNILVMRHPETLGDYDVYGIQKIANMENSGQEVSWPIHIFHKDWLDLILYKHNFQLVHEIGMREEFLEIDPEKFEMKCKLFQKL